MLYKTSKTTQMIIIFVLLVLVAGIFVLLDQTLTGGKADKVRPSEHQIKINNVAQNGFTLGNANAPITIKEFGDLQCPACREASQTVVPEIIEKFVKTGKAKIIFQNLQVIPGDDSRKAARASLAAAKQDKGWQYIDTWYANQGQEGSGYVTMDFMKAVAEKAGVNLVQWEKDYKSGLALSEETLNASESEATKLKIPGTPAFLISSEDQQPILIDGVPDIKQIEETIQSLEKS